MHKADEAVKAELWKRTLAGVAVGVSRVVKGAKFDAIMDVCANTFKLGVDIGYDLGANVFTDDQKGVAVENTVTHALLEETLADVQLDALVTVGRWRVEYRRTTNFAFHLTEGDAFRGKYRDRVSALLVAFEVDETLTLSGIATEVDV